jgi:hypothetical protein
VVRIAATPCCTKRSLLGGDGKLLESLAGHLKRGTAARFSEPPSSR